MSAYGTPPLATPWVPLWPLVQAGQTEQLRAQAPANYTLTTNPTAIPGTTLTLSKGTWLVVGEFDPTGGTTGWSLFVGGIGGSAEGVAGASVALMSDFGFGGQRITVGQCWIVNAPSGGEQVWLYTYKTVAGGSIIVNATHTQITAIKLAWKGSLPLVPGAVSYGITLPASPTDGQEAILVDSLTNPSYQWKFRYNAGSSSAYKWEFVGGAEVSVQLGGGGQSTNSVYPTFVDLPGGPAFTAPRAGDYIAHLSLHAGNNAVGGNSMAAVTAAAGGTVADSDLVFAASVAVNSAVVLSRRTRLNAVAAGASIRIVYAVLGGGLSTFERRALQVVPVRVS